MNLTPTSPPTLTPAGSETSSPPVIPSLPPWAKFRWAWIALGLVTVMIFGILFAFNPSEHSFYPLCTFYRLTGLQCPGCGGLRAVHHLLHGHIATAFRFNPLVVIALPVVVALALRRLLRGPGPSRSHRVAARWTWAVFVLLMVFWIVRNLPLDLFRQQT
jgi:hypothetical protein